MGCFVTNDRRKRGNWQGFYFLRVSMVWLVASVGSKLVEKIIFGFKTRRRLIENGLKQVKLVNNSGFQVSFERWMKFDQKWSGFSWFEKVEFVSNSFSWQNWLKSDEKVRGCLFFGSKLFEIVEVFSSSWWIELLFRVRSGFKIKLFKVHEFVQVSTGTVFRTFQRF